MYRRLLSVFSAEAAERIQRTNAALLGLERDDGSVERAEALTGIMRELHTLKGAGGSVNLEDVETLSHDLESVFGPIVQGERDLNPAVFAVAYQTLDAIEEVIAAAIGDRSPSVDVPALLAAMRAAADASATVAPTPVVSTVAPTQPSSPADESPAETDVSPDEIDREALLGAFAELQGGPFGDDVRESSIDAARTAEPVPDDATVDEPAEEGREVATDEEAWESELESEEAPASEPDPDVATDKETEVHPAPAAEAAPGVDVEVRAETATDDDDDLLDTGVRRAFDDDAARARVLAVFASESLDRVKTINRSLMALERDPAPASRIGGAALAEILRELHTLKGSSATIHVDTVETLAHQLETLFGAVRDGGRTLDPAVFDIAYRALDAVEAAVGEAVRGERADVDVDGWSATIRSAIDPDALAASTLSPPADATADPLVGPDAEVAPPVETVAEVAPAVETVHGAAKTGAEETVRVAISKLDDLMGSVSELLMTRAGAEQRLSDARAIMAALKDVEADWREAQIRLSSLVSQRGTPEGPNAAIPPGPAELEGLTTLFAGGQERIGSARTQLADLLRNLESDRKRLGQVIDDLEEDVRRARMLPVAMVFDAFPRLIRDLAVELDKKATLVVEGSETEVDRSVIEQIRAPLTHLLRNAIDHGIEPPAERERSGKPAIGTIALSASQNGDSMIIEVSDDGGGIDPARIRSTAVERGVLSKEAADATNDADSLRLIFRAGFSTRGVVTDLSGRGVGLDVVRDAVERLRGSVDVDSTAGEGTRFSLRVPLSVATAQCVMVSVGGTTFALPISNVFRILRLTEEQTERAEGRLVIKIDAEPSPVVSTAEVLGLEQPAHLRPRTGIVVSSGERKVVFVVDELIGTQTLVLKPLPPPLVRLRYISGAAILGTGQVIGVLNAADLVRRDEPMSTWARDLGDRGPSENGAVPAAAILVVDDSSVTRTMMKGVLENAGFRVQTAADGMEAWEILRSRPFDVLVTDVNMPEMSGFDLTEKVRADRLLNEVPVVLVTALDSPEDQARGARVGADAYIVKGALSDDRLLEAVRGLI
jgi:two-component system chemotaxis sensor kinase CheA